MTGIEAISNAVPVFRPTEWRNARITLSWMAGLLIAMFAGVLVITKLAGIVPESSQTMLSQLAHLSFGRGPAYIFVQAATAAVLLLAANTAYNDFLRVLFLMACDRQAPRSFLRIGDRLTFGTGIVLLSLTSAVVYVTFSGNTSTLLPLYAVGVFLAFTLSQTGMVAHWRRHRDQPHWRKSLVFNATGAVLSGIVFVIEGVTKFTSGAWVAIVLIGLIILAALRIRRYYDLAGQQLALRPPEAARAASAGAPAGPRVPGPRPASGGTMPADEQCQQDRVGNAKRQHPQVRAKAGDNRGGHVAEDESADLGEDLVAEQDDPEPPGARGQPVDELLDLEHAGQEVDHQHDHDQRRGQRAEYQRPRAQHAPDERAAPGGEQMGQVLLDVILGVEPPELRIVILQGLRVVRQLGDQLGGLRGERRDRRGDEPPGRSDQGQQHDDDGRRPGHPPPGQPADQGIQARRDKQRQADELEHRARPNHQLHQRDGDGNPGRSCHPDEQRRAPVHRPAKSPQATGFLGQLGRLLYWARVAFLPLAPGCQRGRYAHCHGHPPGPYRFRP
jgi:hypothetical protein